MTENMSFSGNGRVYASAIDAVSKKALNWYFIGNVILAQVRFAAGNKKEVREGATGKENVIDSIIVRNDAEFTATITKYSIENLRRLLFSKVITPATGSITNQPVKTSTFEDGVTPLGKFNVSAVTAVTGQALASFTVGVGGTGYSGATQVVIAGSGGGSATPVISAGVITGITLVSPGLYASAPAVSFVDSGGGSGATATAVLSGTNTILTNGTDFTWDVFGNFRRTLTGLIPAGGSVLVSYAFGSSDSVGFNSLSGQEIAIRIEGRNNLRNDSPFLAVAPRLQLMPTPQWDLISIGKTAGEELTMAGMLLYTSQFDDAPIGDGTIPGGIFLQQQLLEG